MPPLRGCEEGIRKIGASSHEPGARAARLRHAAAARLGETGSSSPWLKTGGSRSRATPYRLAASEGGKGPTTNLSLTSQVGWLLVASRTAAACRSLAASAPGSWSDASAHSPLPAAQRRHVVAWRRQPQVLSRAETVPPPSRAAAACRRCAAGGNVVLIAVAQDRGLSLPAHPRPPRGLAVLPGVSRHDMPWTLTIP